MVEQEVVFDEETRVYRVLELAPAILKGTVSGITVVMLLQLWDLYDYQAVGLKKEWYIALYTNSSEGGRALPKGICGTPSLASAFIAEFLIILYHVPPGLDFRFWCCRLDVGD